MSKLTLALAALLALASCRPETSPPDAYFFARRISDATAELDEVQFRSFRKDGRLATILTLGNPGASTESRLSLVPPIPSKLSFDVRVPTDARLDFDIGVSALGAEALPAPVVFSVFVDGERIFEETIRRRFANHWFHESLDLSRWAQSKAGIAFETRFQETPFTETDRLASPVLPAWGNPVLGGRAGLPSRASQASRPDLILVSIDCLRADHVGAYGYPKPITPTLDAFAEDAVLFENAVSVSSWTLPTHMSMLTGLMPAEHGLSRVTKRDPSAPYLPEILAREGYETLGVVSGLYLSPTFGYEQGFDVYRALIDAPAEELVDAARELFLAEPRRPRFLFLHFFDAHWRYLPPTEYLERAGGRPPDISRLQNIVIQETPPSAPEDVAHMQTLYDAELAYVDDHLGRLFDALKAKGLYDDALIIVTADHGEGFYEHELWQHSEIIYNEVTRVPLIVKPPSSSSSSFSGAHVSELVSQLGVFPTFVEAVGRENPFEHPSLLALAEGRASFPERAMTEITWEATTTRGPFVMLAATEGSLKYVATFAGDLDGETFVSRLVNEELYDLATDPGERSNLLPDEVGRAGALRSQVRDYLEIVQSRRARGAGERIVIDEEMEERLRALGYVQ